MGSRAAWYRKGTLKKACGGFGNHVRYVETASIQTFGTFAYSITIQRGAGQILTNYKYSYTLLRHLPLIHRHHPIHNPPAPSLKTKTSNHRHHLLDRKCPLIFPREVADRIIEQGCYTRDWAWFVRDQIGPEQSAQVSAMEEAREAHWASIFGN